MAISINKVSEEIKEKIIKDYLNNKSIRQIEKDYNVDRKTTSKFLEEKGIKSLKGNHYRKYFHDENFFENIDTEEKAYWLGFMFADGYISEKRNGYGQDLFGITLAEQDKEQLEKFKKSLNASNPINKDDSKKYGQIQYKILLTSQKTVDDLIDKGCEKHKSLILKPPKKVPDNLLHHFIRGFFDGDGSLTKTFTPNKNYKYDNYSYGINIVSTKDMVEWLYSYFNFGSIIKEKRRDNTYYLSIGGHDQVKNFYDIIYKDATIYLDRKYNKFQIFISKYTERQGTNVR